MSKQLNSIQFGAVEHATSSTAFQNKPLTGIVFRQPILSCQLTIRLDQCWVVQM